MLKTCCTCKQELPLESFTKDQKAKDGLQWRCKSCDKQYYEANKDKILRRSRQRYADNAEKNRAYAREYRKAHLDQCSERNREYHKKHRDRLLEYGKAYRKKNADCLNEKTRNSYTGKKGYCRSMLRSAKGRAKKMKWEFDLTLDFLVSIATDNCPVDGTPLDWDRKLSNRQCSPSLDRIDSSRGYTKDNVIIIGDQWNRRKNNSELKDLELLLVFLKTCSNKIFSSRLKHRQKDAQCAMTLRHVKELCAKKMLNAAKARAKKKGQNVDLTLNFLLSIATDNCPVDGMPLCWDKVPGDDGYHKSLSPSLDRIDSSIGYTQDNVCIMRNVWNRRKNDMTLQDLELLIKYVRSVTKG